MNNVSSSLEEIFQIFNEVQTGTNTKDNIELLLNHFEKKKFKSLLNDLEQIFLIIIKNYEKNNIPLKNIKDFLKQFISKILKMPKKTELTKELICHFCRFFTQNTKKTRYRTVNIYFLQLFLSPYSNSFEGLYDDSTRQTIKNYILTCLRSKQSTIQVSVLKILQKNVALQREDDIWKSLEGLIENSPVAIKKEILKLLDFEFNSDKLKYLLEMYDDDNWEIRSIVIEKLSTLSNLDLIDTNNKVRILFIGLSDKNEKVKSNAKKFFKNYLNFIGIMTEKNEKNYEIQDNIPIDENINDVTFRTNKFKIENEEEDLFKVKVQTIDEKIDDATSPLRKNTKTKINCSPALLFEKLNFIIYYFNPKFSFVFQLVTDALIECSSYNSLVELYEYIINHILTSSNSVKIESKQTNFNNYETQISHSLLYEILFLQNSIKVLNNTKNDHYQSVNSKLNDILPDTRTLARIIDFFFIENCNPLILHQLFLISNYYTYTDNDSGNREMENIIVRFLSEVNLDRRILKPKINATNIKVDYSGFNDMKIEDDEEDDVELDTSHYMITQVENMLLPPNRKLVQTLEDLIDFALKILLNIFEKQHHQLFTSIMKLITEMKEKLDGGEDENTSTKSRRSNILERIKDKLSQVNNLREQKNEDKKKRQDYDKKIKIEESIIDDLDKELLEVIREEKQIYLRILKLSEFLIKYSKISINEINDIMNTILIPCIKKKDFPEVMRQSYLVMGVCSVNYVKEFNYMQLFFSNIEKNIKENSLDFKDFDMTSLFVIFDAILHNDVSFLKLSTDVNEKIGPIVKKFLYHNEYLPRLITFIGLSKLLIADKIEMSQFYLSRLVVQLFASYEVIDKHSEEYHTKIYEIFQNFIFYYSRNVNNIKVIMESILIILTSKFLESVFLGTSANNNQIVDTVLYNYINTKMEHLVSFINIINSFNINFQNQNKFFVFKIFKFIAFFLLYINDEERKVKNLIKNLYFNRNIIFNTIRKFLEKSKLDRYLNEKIPENYKIKYMKILTELDNKQLLNKISDSLQIYLEEKSEDDMKNEDINKSLENYFETKIGKYFKRIEDFYDFLIKLKEERINIIYEEQTYLSDVEMEVNSNATKEKIIPSTIKKSTKREKSKLDKSPEISKRRKEFKF